MEGLGNTTVQEALPVGRKQEWYETITYEDAKIFIKSNIESAARSFIAIGYYLKAVRDRGLYREDGHGSIWGFAQAEFGISKSTASRYMAMNDRFSKDGSSPVIADAYKGFGKSQLQEMLYLTDEQMGQVSSSDRVEDIRNIRKPKEVPYIHIPGQMEMLENFPGVTPEDVAASAKAREGMAANRPGMQAYTISAEDLLPGPGQKGPDDPVVISQQKKTVPEPGSGVSQETERAEEDSSLPEGPGKPGKCIHRPGFDCTLEEAHKLVPGTGGDCSQACCWDCTNRGACQLECYSSERRMENPEASGAEENQQEKTEAAEMQQGAPLEPDELKEPEQPTLPLLKNNDQRAAFVDAYETWPLWIETVQTGERYYRYDLEDGTSMVVKVYRARLFDGFAAGSVRYHEGYGLHEYYLLQPGKFFRNCEENRSRLIDKLKEIQKGKK